MEDLVFHSPLPLRQTRISGSTVRPRQMLQAFEELGVNVRVCAGTSTERRAIWNEIVRTKRSYLGVYSELATMPLALTDPDHFPRAFALDSRAFQRCRANGWPVSVYYRDVYWRFPEYRAATALWKRVVAYPFHRIELRQLRRSVDHLFLPSVGMLQHIPGTFPKERVSTLPPGGTRLHGANGQRQRTGILRLLYVGSIVPPLYDLTGLLHTMDRLHGVSLTVCCRQDEWKRWESIYRHFRNVKVVHASGAALTNLYCDADICSLVFPSTDYRRFAMPVKLFEALGAGLPIIASANSAVGQFVVQERVGWTVNSTQELAALLSRLLREPRDVATIRDRVKQVREQHTWSVRARQVLTTLESYRAARRR